MANKMCDIGLMSGYNGPRINLSQASIRKEVKNEAAGKALGKTII